VLHWKMPLTRLIAGGFRFELLKAGPYGHTVCDTDAPLSAILHTSRLFGGEFVLPYARQ
jgi:hypothetical protein